MTRAAEFITNHIRLKHRIHSAYFVIGSVSLLIVLVAYLSFQKTTDEFRRFAQYSNQAQIGLQLENRISEIQRAADIFTNDGHQSAADQVHYKYREIKAILDSFPSSTQLISKPHLTLIGQHLQNYIETFKQLQTQRDRQSFLLSTEIRRRATDAETLVQQYLRLLTPREADRRTRGIQILNSLLQVEKNAYRYFDSLDSSRIEKAKDNIQTTKDGLGDILAEQSSGAEREIIHALLKTIAVYENSFLEAVQRTRGYLYLVNVVMAGEAYEILYQAKLIAGLHSREMQAIEQEILSTIGNVIQTVLFVGIAFFIIIVLLSYVIGKSITHPIEQLTDTFRNLSHGSGDTDIPPYRLRDEIGDLSHAAEVFRRKNNETRTLLQKHQELSGELEIKVERRTRELADSNRKLLSAKEAAEAATRAKSDFLANMSHEIRTPMHAIIGMNYLLRQTRLDDHQQEYVKNIDLSANALLHLINDILDFSRIEAGKLKIEEIDFNLHTTIENVAILVGGKSADKQLEFVIAYEPGLPRIFRGDPTRLCQVLTNLVNNAQKFTERGEIGIDIQRGEDGLIRFRVWDTGIGLTEENRNKLFESFSQADASTTRKYGGSGLGLAISKQLVELMGGRIWVQSEYGKGSTFSFEIALQEQPDTEENPKLLDNRQVLLVDHSPAARAALKPLLEQLGMQVLEAGNAEQAMETMLKECRCELILVDWKLPGADGISTVKALRKASPDLPKVIMMVPPHLPESLRRQAQANDIETFLPKPVNPSRLYNSVLGIFGEQVERGYQEMADGLDLKSELSKLRGSNILLVDDNQMNRGIIHGMLEQNGILVDDAENGAQAVQIYQADPERYELIFMDIQMPIMDGYEATRLIRQQDAEVPIVALTADALVSDVEKTRSYGMNEHLNKPIDVNKLFSVLLRYLSPKSPLPALPLPQHATTARSGLLSLRSIDAEAGLRRMMGDDWLYISQLRGFASEYGGAAANLRSLIDTEPKEAKRLFHTFKGLSGNIAATDLQEIAARLYETMDAALVTDFENALQRLVNEIHNADFPQEVPVAAGPPLNAKRHGELLLQLHDAVKDRRPKRIAPLLEELEAHTQEAGDAQLLQQLIPLIRKYRYSEALNLLQEHVHAGD